MSIRLRVIAGPDLGRTFSLPTDAPFVIGRGRDSATQLQDLHVSRAHCSLQLVAGEWRVADLKSSSGTMINGQPVTEAALGPGDVIQIGDTQLRLEEANIADQPTLPPSMPSSSIPIAVPVGPELVAPPPLPRLSGDRMGELAGKVLAHFRLDSLLGRGKSGMVFRAHDIDSGRDVALKLLRPEFAADAQEVNRFIRSMRTALPLRHLNLVQVYAAGKKGPYCWVSMELIEGESLAQVLERIGVAGMLDWRHAFRVAVHLGRALEYAHGQQIIHRNLTPENVLQSETDNQVKLGDLMLAKALEGQLAQQLTRPGEVVGDVRYMAPEQVHSTTHTDARADLYSLGALLYALLTGRPPIDGESLMDLLEQVGGPPAMRPRQLQMSIPDSFEDIVMRLLSPRPEDRFQSAGDLLAALEQVGHYPGLTI
jgi:serine/threonine protein kinase